MDTSIKFCNILNMLELWKKKFTAERFSIRHHNPRVFVLSQWQKSSNPHLAYLIYKWIITMFLIVSWIISIIDISHLNDPNYNRAKWLIYLTNWGFTICTLQSVLNTIMVTVSYSSHKNSATSFEKHKILQLYKAYWISNIIATDIALGITVIYWALIYDERKMGLDGMNIIVHVFNSIIMLIELCVVAHPVRLLHFYCPMICGAFYIIFSLIYYFAGGTNKDGLSSIYPILDWNKAGKTTLVCLMVTVFLIFLHVVTYCIYKMRKIIHRTVTSLERCEEKSIENGKDNPIPVLSNDLV